MRVGSGPQSRRKILAEELRRKNLDCALISNPKHVLYFTGFETNLNMWLTLMRGSRSTSFLTVDNDGRAFMLLGSSELPKNAVTLKRSDRSIFDEVKLSGYVDYDINKHTVTYADSMGLELRKWLKNLRREEVKFKNVGIESWHLADVYRELISDALKGSRLSGISKAILSMRKKKGADEVSHIRKATEMIEYAYKFVDPDVSNVNSELELYRRMNYETFGRYGPFAWIMGIDIARIETKFRKGDTVILDLQAAFHNYWSDLSRTFVVGKWSREQERGLALLVKAKEKGEDLLQPGTKCKEIYNSVSQVLVDGGFSKLSHHAGHGIGLDDQEAPFLIPGSDEEIEEGNVCLLEPGIYAPSTGDMRIEDCYVITKSGPEKISSFPIRNQ